MKKFLFYFTLFLIILAFSTTANYFDYDLWARLIAGMGFVDGGHVLTQDFLSYTPVHTWWDHEWGAGVIFYFFLKYFGGYSLIILQAVLMFGIFFTASKVIELRYNKPFNILFYLLSLIVILPMINMPIRCHMFSFLFFTIFIYLLERVRKGENKFLYLIPIITLFWNNIHGGVVSGLGLLFLYAIGEFLNKKPFKKYLLTLLICCPILLINPWGFDYIKFLLMANTMPRPDIVEWWSIFHKYHMFKYIGFKLFLISLTFAEIWILAKNKFVNSDKTKYIIILTTIYLSVSHLKLIPFFVIASLCFIYEDICELFKNIKLPEYKDKLIYGMIIFLSLFTFFTKDFSLPLGINTYPIKEVEFIKINNIKGKLFSNFNYGSYIAYKLYPNNTIYMDGRYEEVYYDNMIPLQKQFFLAKPNWDTVIKKYPPDVMLIDKMYPIYKLLLSSNEWGQIYEGKRFGVFVPKADIKQNYIQPSDDENYYKNSLFTTDINLKS